MKVWTHWVLCEETKLEWNPGERYSSVKALQHNGVWKLCERNLPGMKYGMELTVVANVSKEQWKPVWTSKMNTELTGIPAQPTPKWYKENER